MVMTSDNTAILFEPITVNATFSETGTLLTTRSTSSESEIVTRLLALLKASPTATALAEFAHKRDLQIGIDRHQDRLARLLPAHRMIALNPFRLEHRDPDIAQGFMALALAHALRDHWQHTHGFAPSPAFHPNDNIRLNRVLNADATALVVLIAREMKENGVYTPATALRHPRTSLLPAYRILAKTRKEIPNVMLTGEDVRDAYL
ncbi:MAG: DUF6782 family putative metallopeptidase, partial [Pseudomonadota bacterium]|nr:DUF6782 family putative metallopeptidase [Pseudomonadota bacterium]